MKPIISRITLRTCIKNAASSQATYLVVNLLKIMAIPLTPPVAKLFGFLKKYMPAANSRVPRLRITQYRTAECVILILPFN